MPVLTLCDIPDELLAQLEKRAERNRRSLEAEAVSILANEVALQAQNGFGQHLRARFRGIYGSDLEVPRNKFIDEESRLGD
ncbi:hypothetical protein SAMN05444413_101506 [Roseivivax marinus]|uniref:FitA-like ribbon-helix-helix domain-containing protein n=1 Tax=Roseivivax marinus TaxID=1379903 RepID=UPI0008B4E643|nr:hypothetical protein [Roseivivax marinus]SEK40150.1 hypothetical protein SAMN05444413_101506 [Roseivivax marinus]